MNTALRPVSVADNEKLAKIIRQIFVEYNAPKTGTVFSDPTTDHLHELFTHSGARLWVAEVNGVVKGCGGIYPTEGLENGCVEFVKFYLAPEARGLGLGKQILERSIEAAQQMGYQKMYLESLPHFSTAIGLYEQYGFKSLRKPLGNSGHTSCNIWMARAL